jgi:hypothetical protein
MLHEISFEVAGLPPIKNEAKPLLSAAHKQARQVRSLLEAARAAANSAGWKCVPGLVSLELIVRGNGRPPGDATNYLGGVADVLQATKDHVMIDFGYLGELRDVALYVNEGQTNRVGYSEEAAERTPYVVRVTSAAS